MIDHPISKLDQFTNHVITKDLTFIVATNPANKSTTDKMTSLETQIKKTNETDQESRNYCNQSPEFVSTTSP